jgi:hypothetical protein
MPYGGEALFSRGVFLPSITGKGAKRDHSQEKTGRSPQGPFADVFKRIGRNDAPKEIVAYLSRLNQYSIIARYPETLLKMEETMDNNRAVLIMNDGRKALAWIQKEFSR